MQVNALETTSAPCSNHPTPLTTLTMPTPRTTATHPTQSPSIERSSFTQTCTQNASPCTHRAQCTRNIYKKKSWYKKVHWTYNALQCLEMSRNAQEVYFISTRRSPSLQENYFAECNISTKTVPVVFKGSQIARQAANQLPASTWPSLSSRQAVQWPARCNLEMCNSQKQDTDYSALQIIAMQCMKCNSPHPQCLHKSQFWFLIQFTKYPPGPGVSWLAKQFQALCWPITHTFAGELCCCVLFFANFFRLKNWVRIYPCHLIFYRRGFKTQWCCCRREMAWEAFPRMWPETSRGRARRLRSFLETLSIKIQSIHLLHLSNHCHQQYFPSPIKIILILVPLWWSLGAWKKGTKWKIPPM